MTSAKLVFKLNIDLATYIYSNYNTTMSKILIIDGNAIVHRAFHALPPLTDHDGEMVNAIYGFFSMLLKVIEDTRPTHVAVCFDRPMPTFRKTLYAGYQAHRPEMPDGLSHQISRLHDALEKVHISIYELDGFEADDVIGTLADQAVHEGGMIAEILTGDRDLLQLVNEKTRVLAPILGISNMTEYDGAKVEEKFGVKPSQFVDYKALVGDSSDGYPGVNGIGPKTASNLLKEFGTFENLYHNLGKITPRIAEKLAKDAEQAALAKKLAKILTDAPVTLHIEKCSLSHMTKEDLYEMCDAFNFNSIKKRIETMQSITSRPKDTEQLNFL